MRAAGLRIQGAVVIGQVALSLLLLVGAGLMISNVWRVLRSDFGIRMDHLAQLSILLYPPEEYTERSGDGRSDKMKPKATLTIGQIARRLRALPGVSAVSVVQMGVLVGCTERPVKAESSPRQRDEGQTVCCEPVSPGYFGMLEIAMLEGRDFTDRDSASSPPVAIISRSVAHRFFPNQDPMGKTINIGSGDNNDFERRQVVGVVADARWSGRYSGNSSLYYPCSQMSALGFFGLRAFLVRSEANPASLVRAMSGWCPRSAGTFG